MTSLELTGMILIGLLLIVGWGYWLSPLFLTGR